ncbi:MAG: hypothetical protein RL172_3274 [Bacteroidota bacterium]|jgi:uncharacterized membrane protein
MIKLSGAEKIVTAFVLFIALMITFRVGYANNTRYTFLLWNLFLAWIPFQLSLTIAGLRRHKRWYRYLLLAGWLLFFPNSLYIITDLIHLHQSAGDMPVWYDAILLFTSSVAGLLMAFVSLFQVELFLKRYLRPQHVTRLVAGALFLGSFGVYVGRFLRWNSWDVFVNPLMLFTQLAHPFVQPLQHVRTWGVTLLLTVLFNLLYFSVKKLQADNYA